MTVSKWPAYDKDEIDAVANVLSSGRVNYWTGTQGREFEREFAEHCGVSYAVALGNGTQALELALETAGIGPGDDVIVTPRTFIASASCAVRLGARPVFADVSIDSQNLTAASVEAVLTEKTKAVVVVHHAGWPCEMDELMALAETHGFTVVEDCAQAHGAQYKGRPVGGLGHVAGFSFCQDKIITTGGEGGMLVTNSEDIWRKAWAIRDHGKSYDAVLSEAHPPGFRWFHESFGTNMRMTEMQAAIGRVQLRKLTDWNKKRNENAAKIAHVFSKYSAARVPMPGDDIRHAYYRLYAFVDSDQLAPGCNRDRIMNEITALGIPCFSGSCPEIYREKAFEAANLTPDEPQQHAVELGPQSLAFLVHPTLTSEDIKNTCDAIDSVMSKANN